MGLSEACDPGSGPGSAPRPGSRTSSPDLPPPGPVHPEPSAASTHDDANVHVDAHVDTAAAAPSVAAISPSAPIVTASPALPMGSRPRNIVIIGGGAIGCTTAYYLTRHPCFNPDIHRITLLEASDVAAAASGKAGGLLARWAYPQCMVGLSYDLHRELADEHNGAEKWGYRSLECGQLSAVVPKYHVLEKSRRKKRKGSEMTGSVPAAEVSPTAPALEETSPDQDHAQGSPTAQEQSEARGAPPVESAPEGQAPPEKTQQEHPEAKPPSPEKAQEPNPVQDTLQETEGVEWQKMPKQEKRVKDSFRKSKLPTDLDWIEGRFVQEYDEMGLEGFNETAQVHPYQFTHAMADMARARGVEIRTNALVADIEYDDARRHVAGVHYVDRLSKDDHRLRDVTDVVLAAGPWTGRLLPSTSIEGLRQHSVVYNATVSPYAVFTFISLPTAWKPPHRMAKGERRRHRGRVDPELYSRPNGEVYACGEPDSRVPLPDTADLVQVDEPHCDDLIAYIGTVSPVLRAAPVATKQACYLPQHVRKPGLEAGPDEQQMPPGGAPLVGATSVAGLWVAAGHSCWGIHNSPATGKLISEFVFEGAAKSADIEPLDPRKFKV